MDKEQRIIVYKSENLIQKIKNFFKRLFYRAQETEDTNKEVIEVTKQNFKENIVIKQDEEKMRILEIQYKYQRGLIEEEDISKEDYQKLIDLYDEQNQKIRKEIEKDKIEIKNMLKKLS